jgi:hypothetical protein
MELLPKLAPEAGGVTLVKLIERVKLLTPPKAYFLKSPSS